MDLPSQPERSGNESRKVRESAPRTLARTGIAVLIAAVLIIQGAQIFRMPEAISENLRAPALYPFLDYPMFAKPGYRYQPVEELRIYATWRDGTRRRILPEDLGLSTWRIWKVQAWILIHRISRAVESGNRRQLLAYLEAMDLDRPDLPAEIAIERWHLARLDVSIESSFRAVLHRLALTAEATASRDAQGPDP